MWIFYGRRQIDPASNSSDSRIFISENLDGCAYWVVGHGFEAAIVMAKDRLGSGVANDHECMSIGVSTVSSRPGRLSVS